MEISKSTPYVRYRENISSTLHKGTIHIESEYLDRERKTTIESIEGQTWQNMVNGENKEEDILPRLGLKIEGNEDILDTKEQHMPIDTIIGDIEPVANEDGTYTYEISTMEGSYAKTLDGENNFSLTSDGLVGDMYIKYNAQGEEVNGNIVMDNQQSNYTIEDSNTGEIKSATLKGQTLVNLQPKAERQSWGVKTEGEIPQNNAYGGFSEVLSKLKPSTKYLIKFSKNISDKYNNVFFAQATVMTGKIIDDYRIITTLDNLTKDTTAIHIYPKDNAFSTIKEMYDYLSDLHVMVIEYQEGMENWDIPYFEGMQSVKMPVLKTSNEDGTKTNILTVNEDVTLRGIGDVQDELDLETGVLTQRIGQIVFNGSENWIRWGLDSFLYQGSVRVNMTDNKILSNKLPTVDYGNIYNGGVYGIGSRHGNIGVRINNIASVEDLKVFLSQNPVTVQYSLATPIITQVDITIKDQDDKIIQSLHTHPSTTHINLSSDGLIPNAELSYTMYGNIGETTGEQITDGTDSKLIEGKVYGDTLLNVLPSPSLKEDDNGNSVSTYLLDMVKPNTQYTAKSSSDCNATIDGIVYPLSANGTFTTPSTITDNLMVLDAPVDDLMFIEGDLTGRELDYFTGLQSVEMPVLTTTGKNLWRTDLLNSANINSFYLNTNYTLKQLCPDLIVGESYIASMNYQYTGSINGEVGIVALSPFTNLNLSFIYTEELGESLVYLYGGNAIGIMTNFQVEKGSVKTSYKPYQGNIVTTNKPITLHKIGDVKDELDLVNECVVRRIGLREYQDGDLTNNNVITDMTNTLYKLSTPTTEPVRIVPQNPKQSTTSLTLQSPLQKVGNVADQLRWNPYKGHYVRYNYIQDGVANSTYIFEDLKDMNERKFVNLYNQRTYIDTDHTVQVISHGLSRYCLAEQGKQYQVRWDWVELPSVDTIKIDLCGNVKEIPSSDNSVVIDVEKFTHQFVQIQGLGLYGKITNLMVIETIEGEIPDVDFFSGIQCVGNTVNIDGNAKVQIDMEQTNGNLIDREFTLFNNGNYISYDYFQTNNTNLIKPNKDYVVKMENGKSVGDAKLVIRNNDKDVYTTTPTNRGSYSEYIFKTPYDAKTVRFYAKQEADGSAHTHYKVELCYADMAKDGIRPRYYDKESIILPMKLCRVGNIYDNLYYDDLRGHYRIQQSIGHKYFTGETTEVWTMETTDGYRTIKFTCTSANIDQIAFGGTICNSFKHLSTINDDMEGFIIYNGNFVIRVDKDRLIDKTVDGFKALLTSSPIHLFYQLKTPQMINLTEYPNRIELNTYRDEIFTFLKGMNPTKFTLSVPMDKTYRYEIAEEGQGLANRVTVNDETISAENMVAVKEVRGQGIANIIEDVNNVVITPRPNHEGRTTSHTLNNTKPAIIMVHGFEPSGDTAIGKYNVTDKAYQLKVMSSNGDNSLSDYYVLNVPYKLETYADGTKDMVYYDEDYKQWHFKGSSVKEYTVASDGTLNEVVEVFKGLAPRSGMIAEFKLMFTSGTTAARIYYSLDGVTYAYTQLRYMSDGNYLYVGIFNTGGTKIDIAYKTDPNAEYTNFAPLSTQVPECFMVNQITYCTFCELTLDKQYIYSEMKSPIELETYEGSTKVFMDGNATDTNIIIRNEGTSKIVNTYTDTDYTVYWKYVDGLGNLRVTLGGTTVEVDGKQEYATLKTQLNAPQELLYVGGYNLSIKDLMVVKGAKIDDLPYFEGSRQVGTLVLDEEGNKSYKITLVQGGSVLEQRDEDAIAFKDDNKHNVVVHKIVGVCPTKVD